MHVARQPVYDAAGTLFGYELLFRPSRDATESLVSPDDGDAATTSTILTALSEFQPADLLGGRPGFINLTRTFLVGDLPVPFDPSVAVLEVLESVQPDPEVIAGARELAESGYRLALDDFVWTPASAPLLEIADIVKVDILNLPWEQVLATVRRVPSTTTMLAEKVENAAAFAAARDAGFTLFQGYHLGRPQTMAAESVTPGRGLALRLVCLLSDPDATAVEVESLLRTDPALTYRVLRFANAAASGQCRTVSSIRDAVILLGMAKLRAWLVLLAFSSGTGSNELFLNALTLACTCELLARNNPPAAPDVAFTAGLLQGIADALATPVGNLLNGLPPLGEELASALLGEPGPLRTILDVALHYTGGRLTPLGSDMHLHTDLAHTYLAALMWAQTAYTHAVA